jgi:hypothetical protein
MNKLNFFITPKEYSEYLNETSKTNNILYNILNYQDPKTLFFYGSILVIFLLIFSHIELNSNILIGLIFYSILIYYFYTDKEINYIDNFEELTTKFDNIDTYTNVIKNYPAIIDLLYYMRDFKHSSVDIYNNILIQIENFLILYEECLQDIKLINNNFSTLQTIKNKILYMEESFNFNTGNINYSKKIFLIKKKTQELLNNFLEELIVVHKKNLYYNGYNISTSVVNNCNILPANWIDTQNEYIRNNKIFDVQDYLVL